MKKVILALIAILFVFLFVSESVAQDRTFRVYTICRLLKNPQEGLYAVEMGWESNQDFAISESSFTVTSAWPANPISGSWDLIGAHPETQMYAGKGSGFYILLWDGRGYPDGSRHVVWTVKDYEGHSSSADASYSVDICKPPATPTPRPTIVPTYPPKPTYPVTPINVPMPETACPAWSLVGGTRDYICLWGLPTATHK